MDTERKELIFTLSLTTLPFFFFPFPLTFLVPLAAFVLGHIPLLPSLWTALACGFTLDLLSSDLPFGLFALCFTLTSAALYRRRLTPWPLLTLFYTLLVSALLFLLGVRLTLLAPLLLLPPLYALALSLPLHLLFHRKRRPASYKLQRPQ